MDQKIITEQVRVPVDEGRGASTMAAYLARPEAPGRYPNVIVGFEMFGMTRYVRTVADRIARLGYTAIIPDFYHRSGDAIELAADAAGRQRGMELLSAVDRDGVQRDVQATLDYLGDRPGGSRRAAMIGLSVGGHIAYYAATQIPLDALVVFYPGWLTGTDIRLSRPEPTLALTPAIAALGTRVLFLLGAADHLFTAADREQIAGCLRDAGVAHEFVVYPGAPHGFFCAERETYRPADAQNAWNRVTSLLAATSGWLQAPSDLA